MSAEEISVIFFKNQSCIWAQRDNNSCKCRHRDERDESASELSGKKAL